MKSNSNHQNIEPEYTLTGREQEAMDRSTCQLCGDQLQFIQATDFLAMKVKEIAKCPSCQIHLKEGFHTLQ